jgi:outer membrane protein assembly factor BamB
MRSNGFNQKQIADILGVTSAVVCQYLSNKRGDFNIYCFDMDNGEILWKYKTNDQITSSPAVVNRKVYIGSKDSKLYCLNANNGSYIWDYKTDSMIESSPTVKDDKVFFGSSDGSIYCLDANDGSYIWSYDAESIIWSSPAVSDENVYFGTLSGDFFCLDINDGNFIWSYTTTSGIWSSPTIKNGKVYFGSNDNFVYCLDEEDGDFIWSYDTGGEVHSSPAIAYGNVYIGALDRGMFCLNAETGNLVWKYLISGGIWSPPSVADDKVYFGTFPCCGAPTYIKCADAYTGDILWIHNTGGNVGMTSSPAIAAGKVFFSTATGKVMVFGEIQFIADANGPYYGNINVPIHFTGSVYGGEPDYSWYWDFGDGNTSTKQNPIHTYTALGEYNVTLTVTDESNNIATDVTFVIIEIPSSNKPPDAPDIDGPTNGKAGVEYEYTFTSTDPNGDNIYYRIDWGDNNPEEWIGPYNSGEEITVNHSWSERGTNMIKAKAEDIYGLESNWGTLEVTMTKNKPFSINLPFLRFLEQHPHLFPILRHLLGAYIRY